MADAKLLSSATNGAIVHLPGRAFPGVVLQGDTLNILISELRELASEGCARERQLLLADILDRLEGLQRRYEAVLDREGMTLPYLR
jgi:hypothetical protein